VIRSHASRGQAIFETTLVIPLFVLAFFALLWAMRDSSLSERVQLGVRYTGMIQSLADPYASFSLYTAYATIDNNSPAAAQPCYAGSKSTITQGHASFWQPSNMASSIPSCALSIIDKPEKYSMPVLLRNNFAALSAQLNVDGLQTAIIGTATNVQASQNFFRSPDVGTLLLCTTLGDAVKLSLEAQNDTTTSTRAAAPLPLNVDPNDVINGGGNGNGNGDGDGNGNGHRNNSADCSAPTTAQFTPPTAPY